MNMGEAVVVNIIQNEIDSIKEQIVSQYAPSKIVLFGSQAKRTATKKSDIDLCIVKDTDNKRDLLTDMYLRDITIGLKRLQEI